MTRYIVSIVTIFVSLLVAGSVTVTTAQPSSRVVHLYQINSITGQSAAYGGRAVQGAELLAKQINDANGFRDTCGNTYTMKLTSWDMVNSREQAIAGLRKAADDPTVLAVVGSTPSTGYVAMVPVAAQLRIPLISPGSNATVKTWNPYAFRVTVSVPVGAPQIMRKLEEKFDLKRVAIIYDISQDAERSEAELVRDLAGKVGYEIVAFEAFRAGDTSFRPQLTTIKAANPDWLGTYGATPELSKIVNQMDELGLLGKVQFFGHAGNLNDPQLWDLTSGRVKGGVNWSVAVDLTSPDPKIQKFVSDYRATFPADPTVYSVYGYQSVQAVVDAVKRSCTATDREKFRDALATTQIDALGGRVAFANPRADPNGENQAGTVMVNRVTGRGTFEIMN